MVTDRPDELKRVMAACRRAWVGVALFSACVNVLMLSVPIYMMQLYDRVLSTRSVDTLLVLSVMVVVALVVFGLLDALRVRVAARVGSWLDRELGASVLSGAVADVLRAGGGVSAQGLRDLSTVRNYIGSSAVMPLFDAPWAPVFLAIIFFIHPLLGWIAVGGAVVLFICAILNDLTTRKKLGEASDASARALNAADAAITNADTIIAMGMRPNLIQRWREMGVRSRQLTDSATDTSGSIGAVAKSARFGLQVAILGVGAYLVLLHEMSAGSMIAAAIILSRALAPFEQLIGSWRLFTGARSAYRRLKELLAMSPDAGGGIHLPRPEGRIDVEGVLYVPPGVPVPVIKQMSFRLDGGEILGVVGPSGAGKTTLVRLVVGSLIPTTGHVRLDGADIRTLADEDRDRYVGYLPQNVELFAGTVRDNIARLGHAEDEEVVAAAKLAGAHEMVLRLPNGYDTRIGAGGVPVSGGQRQRIALARAVFRNPAFIVLDEPNAHLDSDGERMLAQTLVQLRELGATVVLIAQRAGIMTHVDKMLVVRDGVRLPCSA